MAGPQDPNAVVAASDAAAAQGAGPIDQTCASCPPNEIYIRYEYADGTGVPGANYVIQTPTEDGTATGEILAEGKTDDNGEARVQLPDEHRQVEFYFHDDPEGEPYVDPEAERPLEEPEPGFWEGLWKNISEAADWVWGVLKGDFEEDPKTSQIIARMILTMIPGIDQLADVQDLVHVLYRLIWKQEWDEPMHWILLLITLIGLIPVLGSLAKGVLKLVIKEIGNLSGLYAVFNHFRRSNAHRWIRDFARDLTGKHLEAALDLLDGMMARVVHYMTKAKTMLGNLTGWNGLLDEGLSKVARFHAAAPQKLREAAVELQRRLRDTLATGMTRITRRGTRNAQPHTVTQRRRAPPRTYPLRDARVREILDVPKGQRPDPSTYLSQEYIDEHLARFDDGAVRITSVEAVEQYGTAGPPGGFVMPKSDFDEIVADANGDLGVLEQRLGLPSGSLNDGQTIALEIDPEDYRALRIPSGNEGGVNAEWLPGGYTSGGVPEAVMDFDEVPFTPIPLGGQ